MSKSMIISLAATLVFAAVYITDCVVDAKGEEQYEVIYCDSPMIDGVPNEQIFVAVKAKPQKLEKITVEEITTEATTEEPAETPNMTFYGTLELTAYVATGNPCADGVYPQSGYTVASNDPMLWHKWVYISGYGARYVHDTGGMSISCLDLYVDSLDEAYAVGRRNVEVYVYE